MFLNIIPVLWWYLRDSCFFSSVINVASSVTLLLNAISKMTTIGSKFFVLEINLIAVQFALEVNLIAVQRSSPFNFVLNIFGQLITIFSSFHVIKENWVVSLGLEMLVAVHKYVQTSNREAMKVVEKIQK